MATRAYKKLEQNIRQEFHSNVHLLTLIYPPSKEFKNVFKENMFVKSNKAGFQEVVYYLLGIIEPDKLKQRIPTWPILDARMERSFRSEVLKYINELDLIYEETSLPKIATSHLISPGGVKFTKFMLKLSQFVLYVHAKQRGLLSNVLLPTGTIKAKNAAVEHLQNFNIYIGNIASSRKQLKSFVDMQEMMEKEAQAIIAKQKEAHKICKNYDAKLELLKKQALCDDMSEEDMFVQCTKILETFTNLRDRMYKCRELSDYLNGNESQIEYVKGTSNFEDKDENLDLVKMMESYHQLINHQRFEMQPVDAEFLTSQIERFRELNQKVTTIVKNLDQLQPELTKLSNKIQEVSLNDSPKMGKELIPAMESTGNYCRRSIGSTDSLLPLSSTVIGNDTLQID